MVSSILFKLLNEKLVNFRTCGKYFLIKKLVHLSVS